MTKSCIAWNQYVWTCTCTKSANALIFVDKTLLMCTIVQGTDLTEEKTNAGVLMFPYTLYQKKGKLQTSIILL